MKAVYAAAIVLAGLIGWAALRRRRAEARAHHHRDHEREDRSRLALGIGERFWD